MMRTLSVISMLIWLLASCQKDTEELQKTKWFLFNDSQDTTRGMVITEDHVYIAFQNSGLGRVNRTNWTLEYFTPFNSDIPSTYTTCVDADINGNIWVGTDLGISKFDGVEWINYDHTNSPIPNTTVQDIECDQNGNVWIATYHGLFQKENSNWLHYNLDSGLSDTLLRKVKAIDGKLFIGSTVGGISILDNGVWQNLNAQNSPLEGDQIRFFEPDLVEGYWTGSFWHFYKVTGSSWQLFNDQNTGISHSWINDMAMHEDGTRHFATHGGYSVLKADGSWESFIQESSPLPHNIVEMVEVDNYGNVWLGTFGGLAIYNESGIID
jgi:ligand-binding sensor domain-containing protein